MLKPLQVVSGIVERRQTLPILANVLVRKDGEQRVVHRHRPRDPDPDRGRDRRRHATPPPPPCRRASWSTSCARCPRPTSRCRWPARSSPCSRARSRFNLQTLAAEEYPDRRAGRVHRRLRRCRPAR
ncbi:MAG: hypothetical protein MZW92_18760 [Comamonadaceae bacterium]|nr:hypothetical protein [Comamonadaceae bacterium]